MWKRSGPSPLLQVHAIRSTLACMKTLFVYILAARKGSTLYVGVTNDMRRRLTEHREGDLPSFTRAYGALRLVYVEMYEDPATAIHREKQLKKWRRDWKVALIERDNPDWTDLGPTYLALPPATH